MQVVRKSSFTPTPWKNGGGITYEAMRVPAGAGPFSWRVSVAHIDASGPFSDFAAYNRSMVLLRGAGIDLIFDDGVRESLRRAGDLVQFDGALAAHCELLNGPCVDLNLMLLKTLRASVRVEPVSELLRVSASPGEKVLIFPIDAGITLALEEGSTVTLEPWDLAILSQAAGVVRALEPVNAAPTSVFVAHLHPAIEQRDDLVFVG